MQSEQSLPKEIKYAQRTICIIVVLGVISLMTYAALAPVHQNSLTYIEYVAIGVEYLFILFLAWQLQQRRVWVYITLLVLACLAILGSVAACLDRIFLAPHDLNRGSTLYQLYYYGNAIITGVINGLLLYYLTRPVVYSVFLPARSSRASGSEGSGSEKTGMSRKAITILFIIGSCLFLIGVVMIIQLYMFFLSHRTPGSVSDSEFIMVMLLLVGGLLLVVVGWVLELIARIGALIEMAKTQNWIWFVLTIILDWFVVLVYLIAVRPNWKESQ